MSRTRVRRRRTFLAAGVVVVAVTLGPVSRAMVAGADPRREAQRTYVVRSGDTLWSIAVSRTGSGIDPRPLIQAIERANGIAPGDLMPGQSLVVPTSV